MPCNKYFLHQKITTHALLILDATDRVHNATTEDLVLVDDLKHGFDSMVEVVEHEQRIVSDIVRDIAQVNVWIVLVVQIDEFRPTAIIYVKQ